MQPESDVKFEVGRHHAAGGTKPRSSRLADAGMEMKAQAKAINTLEENIVLQLSMFRISLLI